MLLMQGDCLEKLKEVPDASVDMILADLPYGMTDCSWDNIIPFEPLWEQLHRVCKKNAAMVFFGLEPFSTKLRVSNFKEYKYDWVWVKNHATGYPNAKNMPLTGHEMITVFSRGGIVHKAQNIGNRMTYNPQGVKKVMRRRPAREHNGEVYALKHDKPYIQEYENYPSTVLYFNKEQAPGNHPSQKPVKLLEYLIRTYTCAGGGRCS